MRCCAKALAAIVISVCALGGARSQAQVFGSDRPSPILWPTTVENKIQVADGPASITSVRVVVHVHHTCDSDLDMALVHGDTYVRLSSCNGDLGHDYAATRFSDAAPTAIYEAVAPFNGTFRPEGGVLVPFGNAVPLPPGSGPNLASFVGQPSQGEWTLWIDDTADGFDGTLDYWSLEFNGAVDPLGPELVTGAPPAGVWTEQGDAGELPAAAQVCAGYGALSEIVGSLTTGDTDLYQVQICDPADFYATTIGGTYLDTQLFLFDSAGNGVTFDDEEPGPTSQSIISPTFLASGGLYYLAITASGRTPADAGGQPIWLEEPAVTERCPDGPGAANTLAAWAGQPLGGDYRIFLSGACFARTPCASDYNGDGDAMTDQDVLDFFACLQGSCCPTCGSTDIDGDGNPGTDADIAAFFRMFSGGC